MRRVVFAIAIFLTLVGVSFPAQKAASSRFEIIVPRSVEAAPLDGRILLLFSTKEGEEPRFHVVSRTDPEPFFGIDVEGLEPDTAAVIDDGVLGFPISSLRDLPPGEYNVQAVLNRYTTFHRADGKVVKLHMDHWEGQQWERSPGNLYSIPRKIRVDPAKPATFGSISPRPFPRSCLPRIPNGCAT